jgi:site-specific recombinase XerD
MIPALTLAEAVEQYMTFLQQQNKSKATLYTYSMDLKQVLDFFGTERLVQTISLPQVGKFYRSDVLLKCPNGKNRAEQTVRKTVRVFRMFILWLHAQGWIDTVPLPKQLPQVLSMEPEDKPLV